MTVDRRGGTAAAQTEYERLDARLRACLDEDETWAHEASLLDEDAGYVAGGVHWRWTDSYGNPITLDPLTMTYADEGIASGDLLLESVETYRSRHVGEMHQLALMGAYEVPLAVGAHIARHDPAAVRADIAGKRALLDHVAGWEHTYVDGDTWFSCSQATGRSEDSEPGSGCADELRAGKPCDCGLDDRRLAVLRTIALGYQHRYGFKLLAGIEPMDLNAPAPILVRVSRELLAGNALEITAAVADARCDARVTARWTDLRGSVIDCQQRDVEFARDLSTILTGWASRMPCQITVEPRPLEARHPEGTEHG